MDLKTKDGLTLVSEDDFKSLLEMKSLFKKHRDTVATIFKLSKEKSPAELANLMSKLWRISDEIMDEMRKLGEEE